jgi:hypothetical protein
VGIALRFMVYIIFRNFERERVGRDLRKMDLRECLGRQAGPTAAVIDRQSLKAAEKRAATLQATTLARKCEGPQNPRARRYRRPANARRRSIGGDTGSE